MMDEIGALGGIPPFQKIHFHAGLRQGRLGLFNLDLGAAMRE